ncbi:MAG: V-type ATP synthase subunit E family protein [Desulfurococcaceae archaeon]
MNIEEIRKAVIERASFEANEILRKAEEEASKIIKEAIEKKNRLIEEERKKIIESIKAEVRLSEARLRARALILMAKNEIVEAIKKNALEIINSLDLEKRRESLKNILRESIEELFFTVNEPWNIVIKVSEKDIPLIKEIISSPEFLGRTIDISRIEPIDIKGGTILSCCNDEVVIDNSYESRFEKALRFILPELYRVT